MSVAQIQRRSTQPERDVLREHFGKLTYQQIGEMLGRPWTSVRHQANALRLTQGSNLGRRYSTNLGFFATPSPLNSYWAGFIAADGCVRGKKVQLALGSKDADHVARCASDMGYTGPVHRSDGRCTLQVSCQAYAEDLAKHFNITPRKSLTLEPPNITTEPEIRAFITGVIDGDGSITTNRYRSYTRPRITIYGSAALLEWIRSYFDRWSTPDERGASRVRPSSRTQEYQYSVTARRAVEVAAALREVDVPRLARKWDRLSLAELA